MAHRANVGLAVPSTSGTTFMDGWNLGLEEGQVNTIDKIFVMANKNWGAMIPHKPTAALLALFLLICVAILLVGDSPGDIADGIAKREAQGQNPRWNHDRITGHFYAAWIGVVLSAVLLGTMRWWARPILQKFDGSRSSTPKWFYAGLLGAVLLAGSMRWNLANGSLWFDELWNSKHNIVGHYRTGSKHPDELKFYASDWERCAWYYQRPMNHPLQALLAKGAHETWRKVTVAADAEFDELFIRLPVLLFGLGAVAGVALLGRLWGMPGIGIAAAFFLAVHPWHIRYSIDARGYSGMVFFSIIATWAIWKATCNSPGRWRYWWIFAATQWILMWNHLHSLWLCAALFATGAFIIYRTWEKEQRVTGLLRLGALNVAAVIPFVLSHLPNLIQLKRWHHAEVDESLLDWHLLFATLSEVGFGINSTVIGGVESAGIPSFMQRYGEAGGIVLALVCTFLWILGLIVIWRKQRTAGWLLLAFCVGAAILKAGGVAHLFYFYQRFLVFMLVPLSLTAAAGVWGIVRKRALALPAGIVALGLFVWLTFPQQRLLQTRSYAPMRETVKFLQANSDANTHIVGYGLGGRIMAVYDKDLEYILGEPGREQLQKVIEDARANDLSLLVYYGYSSFNRLVAPTAFELLDDQALFEEIAAFPGIEPEFYFRVMRLR
ncbi:MAG: hypothetical protein ACI9R3_004970 [Verrucomicrobiales bacterium]|jgi:hypothetical protein